MGWIFVQDGEAEARRRLGSFSPPPSAVVFSGHGLHAYWFLKDFQPAPDIVQHNKLIERALESDHVHDAPRLLRLPGTFNMKPGEPVLAVVESVHIDRRYGLPRFSSPTETPPTDPHWPHGDEEDLAELLVQISADPNLDALFRGTAALTKDRSTSGYDFSLVRELASRGVVDITLLEALLAIRPGSKAATRPDYARTTVVNALRSLSVTFAADLPEDQEESLPPFPESAWLGVFAEYRDLLEGTTESPMVFAWGALAAGLSALVGRNSTLVWGPSTMPPILQVSPRSGGMVGLGGVGVTGIGCPQEHPPMSQSRERTSRRLHRWLRRQRAMSVRQLALRLLLALLVALVTAELAMRPFFGNMGHMAVVAPSSLQGVCLDTRPGAEVDYTGWLLRVPATTIHIDSLGARGPERGVEKPAGNYRILALGDSFTLGQGVEEDDSLPALLEAELRAAGAPVEVWNFGVPGTSPPTQVARLEQRLLGLGLAPDMVLVTVSPNDDSPSELSCGPRDQHEPTPAFIEALHVFRQELFTRHLYLPRVFAMVRQGTLKQASGIMRPPSEDGGLAGVGFDPSALSGPLLAYHQGFVRLAALADEEDLAVRVAYLRDHATPGGPTSALLSSVGLGAYDLTEPWGQAQGQADRYLIAGEWHCNPAGNALLARTLADALLRERPWEERSVLPAEGE